MLFMVIEHYGPGMAVEVYRRFREVYGNVSDGSRTAAHRETGWMSYRTLRLRAPHFYPNQLDRCVCPNRL